MAVEEVLSYGIRKRYHANGHKHHTSSVRVLQGLSKSFPVAYSTYQTCFGVEKKADSQPDYAQMHGDSPAEAKILWIRTALVEHTLKPIVDEILKKPV